MRTHAHPLASLAIAAATLIGFTACSSDSTSAPTTVKPVATTGDTTAPTTAETTAPTTAPTTADTAAATTDSIDTTATTGDSTGSSAVPTPDQLTAQLEPLLLTPEEIGPSFVKDTFTDPEGGTPCGVEVDTKYPPYAIAWTQLVQPEPLLAML
ncbi:MAG: hypothetical protein JWL72_4280, partial [Ilumatobacteraceae bacterium]|nr:hypothetical protein [Ilumatobacteraceae bacterium]